MSGYADYRFRFPASGIAQALAGFDALRQVGLVPAEGLPLNMLGDPINASGETVAFDDETGGLPGAVFIGRRSGAHFYIHIRSSIDPASLPVSPAAFGLETTTAEQSAAVLGVWF
jgi:hypothetical protein